MDYNRSGTKRSSFRKRIVQNVPQFLGLFQGESENLASNFDFYFRDFGLHCVDVFAICFLT